MSELIIENNSDLELTDEQIVEKLKKHLGCRFDLFSMRNTKKVLITKNYDVIGLLSTGFGNKISNLMNTGVDIYEIGNLKTGEIKR